MTANVWKPGVEYYCLDVKCLLRLMCLSTWYVAGGVDLGAYGSSQRSNLTRRSRLLGVVCLRVYSPALLLNPVSLFPA